MTRQVRWVVFAAAACALLGDAPWAGGPRADEGKRGMGRLQAVEGLSFFVKNVGQCGPEVLYYADAPWGRLTVRGSDLVFQFAGGSTGGDKVSNVYVRLAGTGFGEVRAEEPLATRVNIFKGDRPSGWFTDIPTYGIVRLAGFSPGTELVIGSESARREGWWLEGASSGGIPLGLRLDTDLSFREDESGCLIETRAGTFFLPSPRVVPVPCPAARAGGAQDTGREEAQQLLWGTYIGGSSGDDGQAVAIDSTGDVVVAGHTESNNIPTPGGFDQTFNLQTDIYVAKVSANGSQLLWGTYLGGSSWDYGWALVLDADGNPIVGGGTYSSDIPTPGGFQRTRTGGKAMYVAKLSASGSSLLWGTYVDGSIHEECNGLALDASGNVVFGGYATSHDMPVPGGYDTTYNGGTADLYVGKLSANGASLLWGTYLGGSGQDALTADRGVALAVDTQGNVFVGTSSDSTATPMPTPGGFDQTKNGGWDCWGGKLSSDGSQLLWGTFLGGAQDDQLFALALDASENVVVAGTTRSADIPAPGGFDTTYNGGLDGFVAKLSSGGSQLLWGTYIGGAGDDSIRALASDGAGNVVMAGTTRSDNIPVPGGLDTTRNGWEDLYLAVLSPDGAQLLSGTFIGGSQSDFCTGIALDGTGGAVAAGYASSSNMPVPGGYDTTHNGGHDFYLAKLSDSAIGVCRLTCAAVVPARAAPGDSVSFQGTAIFNPDGCAAPLFDWDFGDGTAHSGQQNPSHAYAVQGSYGWRLSVSGSGVAPCVRTGFIAITSDPCSLACDATVPAAAETNAEVTFTGSATPTECTQPLTCAWTFGDGATSTLQSPTHTYTSPGTYDWSFTVASGLIQCTKSGSITIITVGPGCFAVGSLVLCADHIAVSGSTRTFSGHVRINEMLHFTGDVTLLSTSSTTASLATDAEPLRPGHPGRERPAHAGPRPGLRRGRHRREPSAHGGAGLLRRPPGGHAAPDRVHAHQGGRLGRADHALRRAGRGPHDHRPDPDRHALHAGRRQVPDGRTGGDGHDHAEHLHRQHDRHLRSPERPAHGQRVRRPSLPGHALVQLHDTHRGGLLRRVRRPRGPPRERHPAGHLGAVRGGAHAQGGQHLRHGQLLHFRGR